MLETDAILERARDGRRIDDSEALALLERANLLDLAQLADERRRALHLEDAVTFVVDRNINYTNVCVSNCAFCAFHRKPTDPDGYVLGKEELRRKIEETLALGGTQILLQGGLNPSLTLEDHLDMLAFVKGNFPIHIHGFSPPEILYMAERSGKGVREVLAALIEAGLGSIPGGGAEILVDEVRERISPDKYKAGQWLSVMETAHEMGLKTTATMMFGHVEKRRHIVEHLGKIRSLQDRTGGFTAFIPWTFQPDNTRIPVETASAVSYLKVLALSRIYLDNVPNIQASWVTQGDKIAQVALGFGANDFGSTMIEENVVAAAGVRFRLPREEIVRLIRNAGYEARQRDCFYNVLATC